MKPFLAGISMIHPRTLRSLDYYSVIEYAASFCVSQAGKTLALEVRPLAAAEEAQQEYALFEQCRIWAASPGAREVSLHDFPDPARLLDKVGSRLEAGSQVQRLDLDDAWVLREMLSPLGRIHASILGGEPGAWPGLVALASRAPMPVQLMAALERCISPDGLIRDESSPELYRLRSEIRSLHQSCLRNVKEYATKYNMLPWLQDEFMTLSSDRYVLPLKANFKGRMQGVIHDWSQTGETCYFEPMFLVEVNNRLQELKHEEREAEAAVLDYLTSLLAGEFPAVQHALELLAHLDMYMARSRFADSINAVCVTLTESSEGIVLPGARHPGMAIAAASRGAEPPRPLDIILRQGERILVITGGNAGGKTVCLKTLGLVSALAMSGLPVPVAPGGHIPWFERLDAFIGDEQSLEDRVSTFTAQIDHLAKAWKYLGQAGLILLDEFGAGTDPAEGSALAQAVLDGLLDINCFVLAATHFPALKTYALTREGVRAASMLFNPQTNRPLFRLAYDQVGASQALALAQAHGLPGSVLARARHYLLQDGSDTTPIMNRLNTLAAEREVEIERLRQEQEKIKNAHAEKQTKLEQERRRLETEIRARIVELMHSFKSEKATARQTARALSGLREELGLSVSSPDSVLPKISGLEPGMSVHHIRFNKRGTIREIDSRRKRARLDLDGVSVWASFDDLREGATQEERPVRQTGSVRVAGPGSLKLDVRGQRTDEALMQVGSFLDRAILEGFSEVEIVHGRGTGALRREIHALLRRTPQVAGVELAPADRGGDGMTIVRLP